MSVSQVSPASFQANPLHTIQHVQPSDKATVVPTDRTAPKAGRVTTADTVTISPQAQQLTSNLKPSKTK